MTDTMRAAWARLRRPSRALVPDPGSITTVTDRITEARRRLGAMGKLEGGSGPGVMGTDNGPDVRIEGPA